MEYQISKKVAEMSTSRNKKELKSFLKPTNFDSKYLLAYIDQIEPFAKFRTMKSNFTGSQEKLSRL